MNLDRPSRDPNLRNRGDDRGWQRALALLLPLGALLVAVVALSMIGRTLFGPKGGVLEGTATPAVPTSTRAAVLATATPSPTATATATATASPTPTLAPSPTPLPTPIVTPAPVVTPRPVVRSTPAPTPRPTRAPALPARDPAETVARFYYLVESQDFDAAAALWTARMRRQYPPRGYIDGRFARTTRIVLRRNEIVSLNARARTAVVAVSLTEYRTVEPTPRRFAGRWDLVLINGQWLLDRPHF